MLQVELFFTVELHTGSILDLGWFKITLAQTKHLFILFSESQWCSRIDNFFMNKYKKKKNTTPFFEDFLLTHVSVILLVNAMTWFVVYHERVYTGSIYIFSGSNMRGCTPVLFTFLLGRSREGGCRPLSSFRCPRGWCWCHQVRLFVSVKNN